MASIPKTRVAASVAAKHRVRTFIVSFSYAVGQLFRTGWAKADRLYSQKSVLESFLGAFMKQVSWGWLLKSERRKKVKEAVGPGTLALIFLVAGVEKAEGQNSEAPPTKMAPLEQYLMDRKEEISLAESAAPAASSQDAEI